MKNILTFFIGGVLISILPPLAYSQTSPSSQSAGAIQAQEERLQEERQLEQQIISKKQKTKEAVLTEKPALPEEGQKTLVKEIDVKGVTLIPRSVVDNIIINYEWKDRL